MNGEKEDVEKGHRLGVLIQTPEWREFLNLCAVEYETLLMRAVEDDDAQARGGIKTLNNIFQSIYGHIKFGEDCRKKFFEEASRRQPGITP